MVETFLEWEQCMMISISTAPCVSTDCWKRWWTMGANSLLHSLRHQSLILLGTGASFGLIFTNYFLTSSTCSVIGCPFSLIRVSNSKCTLLDEISSFKSSKEDVHFVRYMVFIFHTYYFFLLFVTSYHLHTMPY